MLKHNRIVFIIDINKIYLKIFLYLKQYSIGSVNAMVMGSNASNAMFMTYKPSNLKNNSKIIILDKTGFLLYLFYYLVKQWLVTCSEHFDQERLFFFS